MVPNHFTCFESADESFDDKITCRRAIATEYSPHANLGLRGYTREVLLTEKKRLSSHFCEDI